jgi:hypothetical protein
MGPSNVTLTWNRSTNDCAGEDQQQSNRPTNRSYLVVRQLLVYKDMSTEVEDIVEIRYQAKTSEDIAN